MHHHERYDGNGYPAGLQGEGHSSESRMIAIAEAFDAMVSRDSYKYVGRPVEDNKALLPRGGSAVQLKSLRIIPADPGLMLSLWICLSAILMRAFVEEV